MGLMGCLLVSLALLAITGAACAGTDLLTDATWENGLPVGWNSIVGAGDQAGSATETVQQSGTSIQLSGSATTTAWSLVSRTFAVGANENALFTVTAAAPVDLQATFGTQFHNCFIRLRALNGASEKVGEDTLMMCSVLFGAEAQTEYLISHVTPANTAAVQIGFFLSNIAGSFVISDVCAEVVSDYNSLTRQIDRYYSYFEEKSIDWTAVTLQHKDAIEAATTPGAFITAITPLLAALQDTHVYIQSPDSTKTYPFTRSHVNNMSPTNVLLSYSDPAITQGFGQSATLSKTKDGKYAYLWIGTLALTDDLYNQINTALVAMLPSVQGLILDLRSNVGGAEVYAQYLMKNFVREDLAYGTTKYRNGPLHTDFSALFIKKVISTTPGEFSGLPIVGLIGPGCVSSCEGFASILQALSTATLIGNNTFGASGNPSPLVLSNGVQVSYSRWVAQTLGGTVIEDNGVAPDHLVQLTDQTSDSIILDAIARLDAQLLATDAPDPTILGDSATTSHAGFVLVASTFFMVMRV